MSDIAFDEGVFTLTDEDKAAARAELEYSLAAADATDEQAARLRGNLERSLAMTWQERRDHMTEPDDGLAGP